MSDTPNDGASEFERESERASRGSVGEFWDFMAANKKWWLIPLIIFFVIVGLFIFLTSTPAAPFIYTLF